MKATFVKVEKCVDGIKVYVIANGDLQSFNLKPGINSSKINIEVAEDTPELLGGKTGKIYILNYFHIEQEFSIDNSFDVTEYGNDEVELIFDESGRLIRIEKDIPGITIYQGDETCLDITHEDGKYHVYNMSGVPLGEYNSLTEAKDFCREYNLRIKKVIKRITEESDFPF